MKNKKTKLLMRILLLLPLCMVMLGAGCEKDKNKYDPDSIIGEWHLIKDGTCVSPEEEVTIKITKDSVFNKYLDGNLEFTSTFSVKTSNMGYDTLFYHSDKAEYDYVTFFLIGTDTLNLVPPILTAIATCNDYKHIN